MTGELLNAAVIFLLGIMLGMVIGIGMGERGQCEKMGLERHGDQCVKVMRQEVKP